MEATIDPPAPAAPESPMAASKRVLACLTAAGQSRLELLLLELEEERERWLRALLLAAGAAVFALLAGMAFTMGMVLLFWRQSPIGVLLTLAVAYGLCAAGIYERIKRLQRDWPTLPETVNQLRKDRACVDRLLA